MFWQSKLLKILSKNRNRCISSSLTFFSDYIFQSYYALGNIAPEDYKITKILNGKDLIDAEVIRHYQNSPKSLKGNITDYLVPKGLDSAKIPSTIEAIHSVILNEPSLYRRDKERISAIYPTDFSNVTQVSDYLYEVLILSLQREYMMPFHTAQGDYIENIKQYFPHHQRVKPKDSFCGRQKELEQLHQLLNKHSVIFLQGVDGMGKTELARKYASVYHQKPYYNIIYSTFATDLKNTIASLSTTDYQDIDEEYERNMAILESCNSNTLLIIDDLKCPPDKVVHLKRLLKLKCRVLIITSCNCRGYKKLTLKRMPDDDLIKVVKEVCLYINPELDVKDYIMDDIENIEKQKKVFALLHGHTMSVVMLATLLINGLARLDYIYRKLKEHPSDPRVKGKFNLWRKGKREIYAKHIEFLFELFNLTPAQQHYLSVFSFFPLNGIPDILLKIWIIQRYPDIHKGFQELILFGLLDIDTLEDETKRLSAHPIIHDLSLRTYNPSVTKLTDFLAAFNEICLNETLPTLDPAFINSTLVNILNNINQDNPQDYWSLLTSGAYSFASTYSYTRTIDTILENMKKLSVDPTFAVSNHRAVYHLLYADVLYNRKDYEGARAHIDLADSLCDGEDFYDEIRRAHIYASKGKIYSTIKGLEDVSRASLQDANQLYSSLRSHHFWDNDTDLVNNLEQAHKMNAIHIKDIASSLDSIAPTEPLVNSPVYVLAEKLRGRINLSYGNPNNALTHFVLAVQAVQNIYGDSSKQKYDLIEEIEVLYNLCGYTVPQEFYAKIESSSSAQSHH